MDNSKSRISILLLTVQPGFQKCLLQMKELEGKASMPAVEHLQLFALLL